MWSLWWHGPSETRRRQHEKSGVALEIGRRVSQVVCRGPCLGRTGLLGEAYHRRLRNGNKGTSHGDLHALTDTGHAALVETVVRYLTVAAWLTRVEAISASGAIDVLAFHPEHRMLLVVEVKSHIVDIQRTLREIGYRRAAWRRAATEQGWDARAVSTLLVIRETSAQRRLVARHRGIFDSAMPLHGAEARAWLAQPTVPAGLLLFMSIVHGQNVIHADSVRVRYRRTESRQAALDPSVAKRERGPASTRPACDSGRSRPIP